MALNRDDVRKINRTYRRQTRRGGNAALRAAKRCERDAITMLRNNTNTEDAR